MTRTRLSTFARNAILAVSLQMVTLAALHTAITFGA